MPEIRVVLVEPRAGGNVGAVARAMKNLGLARLDVVAPACDVVGDEARRMAVDAVDLLRRARRHDDLGSALTGATTVVGTSRRSGKHRRPHYRVDAIAGTLSRLADAGETALVFGREDRGLHDDELDRCTHLVYLPSAEDYPSLNLAQAVLLVGWELRRAGLAAPRPEEPVAEDGKREAMFDHWQAALEAIGFLHDDSVEPIMRRLRRALGKAELTSVEVRLLRGIARQILWVADRAGLEIPASVRERGLGGGGD